VGCEGASERSYVRWLQGLADDRQKHLFFDPYDLGGGDPLSIVEHAEKKLREQERRKGKYAFKAVILDSDRLGADLSRDQTMRQIIQRAGFSFLDQHEIHEAILLRHFPNCQTLRPRKGSTETRLKREWPTYEKPEDAISLRQKLDFDGFLRMLSVEQGFDQFLGPLLK
jgi:hypothetical protein